MNKVVYVAKLKLNSCPHIVEADDLGEGINDFETTLYTAQVIISHLKDKEFVKKIAIDHKGE
jgi:hypothetical protein